jgi:MFS family permease
MVWAIGNAGFVLTYVALLLLESRPSGPLLWLMVIAQGGIGFGMTAVFGAIAAEIFEGRHYGSIFGTLMFAAISGGAAGPWTAGAIHDATGSYAAAWWLAIGACAVAVLAIARASPGKVRAVAGRMRPG